MRKLALLLALAPLACSKHAAPPAPPAATVPSGTDITFASTPPGAQVRLDGKPLDGKAPLTVHLATGGGDHHARFSLDGYEPEEVTFLVGLSPDTVKASLTIAPKVKVTSDPSGAQVQVDGQVALAATPGEVALTHGEHELVLTLAGRVTARRHVKDGEKGPLAFTLPPAAILAVTSTPPGARIYVDGIDSGLVTPAPEVPVAANRVHRIEARLEKLRSHPTAVKKLRPGTHKAVALKLLDLGKAELVARRREVQRELDRLQEEQQRYEKKTSHFVVKNARQELADERHLKELGDKIQQLADELADLNDQLEPQ